MLLHSGQRLLPGFITAVSVSQRLSCTLISCFVHIKWILFTQTSPYQYPAGPGQCWHISRIQWKSCYSSSQANTLVNPLVYAHATKLKSRMIEKSPEFINLQTLSNLIMSSEWRSTGAADIRTHNRQWWSACRRRRRLWNNGDRRNEKQDQ